jgi:hypothetical protein
MLSKKRLIPLLAENGFETKGVGYEAFGKEVHAFVHVKDMAERARLEALLRKLGHKYDRHYFPGAPVVDVRVSYFKAWHWDE